MWHSAVTDGIEVAVRPMYRRKDSSPKENLFVWSYEVKITNGTDEAVQLMNRQWSICDAEDQVQKVHGPGVVGERPVIDPGDSFTYSSFTHLTTASGEMVGKYEMIKTDGTMFTIEIPCFPLELPVKLVDLSDVTPLAAARTENTPQLV